MRIAGWCLVGVALFGLAAWWALVIDAHGHGWTRFDRNAVVVTVALGLACVALAVRAWVRR